MEKIPICGFLNTEEQRLECSDGRVVGYEKIAAMEEDPEPYGEQGFVEQVNEYYRRGKEAAAAGAEGLMLGDFCSLAQARAAVLGCRRTKLPLYVMMVCDEDGMSPGGESMEACLVVLQDLGLAGFGITGSSPKVMLPVVERMLPYGKVPLMALGIFPSHTTQERFLKRCRMLREAGAAVLGEAPPVHGEMTEALRELSLRPMEGKKPQGEGVPDEQELVLAAGSLYFLDTDLEYSPPVACALDMMEELKAATEEACDAVLIPLDTPDDGYAFGQNAHLLDLPVAFVSESLAALRAGLFYYNGKALVRSTDVALERGDLERIAKDYGAIVL